MPIGLLTTSENHGRALKRCSLDRLENHPSCSMPKSQLCQTDEIPGHSAGSGQPMFPSGGQSNIAMEKNIISVVNGPVLDGHGGWEARDL